MGDSVAPTRQATVAQTPPMSRWRDAADSAEIGRNLRARACVRALYMIDVAHSRDEDRGRR